ncbi:MAG: hypothetical protein ACRDKY_10545 [Solirubrobacteraceae bacterium]
MFLPSSMDWDEAVAASDEEIISAYIAGGMDQRTAEAFAAEIRAAADRGRLIRRPLQVCWF